MKEVWLPIKNYENLYEVSNLGNVRSLGRIDICGRFNKPIIMKQKLLKTGYLRIGLRNIGAIQKQFNTHRLVAFAFIPNPENKKEVNHKNGNKSDNRVENLEWATPSENIRHSFDSLKRKPVSFWKNKFGKDHHSSKKIKCINTGQIFDSIRLAAKNFGFNEKSVGAVVRGESPSIYGYKFQKI